MIRFLAGSLMAMAVLTAPTAGADPNDLVPTCTGGQIPETGECNPAPVEAAANPLDGLFGDAPGGSPNVQVGLTPQNQPVVAPLGVMPANQAVTLPLGVTPPNLPATR